MSLRLRQQMFATSALGFAGTLLLTLIAANQVLQAELREVQVLREKIVEVADVQTEEQADSDDKDAPVDDIPGAGLKTDPELETFLKKAELFVADERYDLATILWPRVLNESDETVMTRPEWMVR